MRKKEELLKDIREDIINPTYSDKAPLWVAFHMTEVLIDIRDVLDARLASLDNTILKYIIPKS